MNKNILQARKALLALFAMLMPLVASAQTKVEIDGIWYNLVSSAKQAEVTFKGSSYKEYSNEYSGSITIPATVTYNGAKYSVTSIGYAAFCGCSSLTVINIPEGVTSIRYDAFYGCSNLTAITIPESVTSIGYEAFDGCSSLKTVINYSDLDIRKGSSSNGYVAYYADIAVNVDEFISDYAFKTTDGVHYLTGYVGNNTELTLPTDYQGNIYQIGDYAFYNCSSLTAINIPENSQLTSIGERAFLGCSSLTTITIPEKSQLTSIGEYAFSGCSSLPAITIPKGVTSIGKYAFSGCSRLTAITIPKGVTSIGEAAFDECSSLTTINIPESVTSIGSSAFSGCSSLTTITIPESVTSIGGSAFRGCRSLTAITIPESVTSIGSGAFEGCRSLTAITIPEGVTSIGREAFYNCSGLTTITIPESVTSIGDYAFYNCSSLTTITIPESVTSIRDYAFSGCSSLTSITIPKGVTNIGNWAFDGCSSLKTVINYSDLPIERGSRDYGRVAYYADRVINLDEFIGDYAFKTKKGVHYLTGYIGDKTELTLPADYKGENYQIGDEAFAYCSSLTAITLPESVTSIGSDAFRNCSSLTAVHISSIEAWCKISFEGSGSNPLYCAHNLYLNGELVEELIIPEGIATIKSCAFEGCSSLTSITIPESVTWIGGYAFSGCSKLTTINIPESVTSIGSSAFYSCSSLEKVTINCVNVGNWFSGMSSIKEIVLGESVRSIGERAFSGCSGLESLHIAPNVDSYASAAFEGCTAIKELTVMGSIMPEIHSEKLTSITLHSPIPLKTKEFAAMVYRNATLNIPEGSLTRYQNADVWKNFWYVNEFDPKKGKAVFLTINQADNGYVKQHLTEGTVCTFTIVAAEGWKIHSVTFNGEEVTAQLTEEGTFTTPALSEDAVLNIAYEQEVPESVENAHARAIKVRGLDNTIHISGLAEDTTVTLYTTDGAMVAHQQSNAGEVKFTVDTNQVYLVHIGDKVVKIGM